jgi:hypothetical protein
MSEPMTEEIKQIYGKKRSALKEKADSMRGEIKGSIEAKRNESYKEVESK